MNMFKKGFAPIIFVLIIALLVAGLGGYVYLQSKDKPTTNTTTTIAGTTIDQILVYIGSNDYLMDVPTGTLLVVENINSSNIFNKYGFFSHTTNFIVEEGFSGINLEDTEKEKKSFVTAAPSKDRKSAIILLQIFDKALLSKYNPDSPGSQNPLLRQEDYLCDFLKKECTLTNIEDLISNAFLKRFPDSGPKISVGCFDIGIMPTGCVLDSEKNILYGTIIENYGTEYLFAFDLNNKDISQISTSTMNFLSPNLNKFAVFEPRYGDVINGNYKKILWLYSTDDFTNPIKKIDLSSFLGLSPQQITWSKDEKKIALYSISDRDSDIREIFIIDLDSDQVSQIWNKQLTDLDNFRGTSFRLFLQGFSESGKYLIFQERVNNFEDWILKAFDLQENKEIELFRGYLNVLATF